ncbi:MAG: hypothetical protein HY901_29090, partial [Deltaproteobacteria bacterium]|nr:hypothetical protein [Deltaproteobacteria bacterium]
MTPVAAALVVAIAVQDPTPLRALPRDTSPKIGQLASGEWLEVREEKAGYLKVWDHRHERPGYVRGTQVRTYRLDETSAPALAAVIAFLKDSTGSEALGIGLVAAYLKAAPAQAIGPGVFDALGTFAERLARRASARRAPNDETLSAHLGVAAGYGVRFHNYEQADRARVCYEGEAFRRVLALGGASPEQRIRAALALTLPECVSPELGQTELLALLQWQADILARIDPHEGPAHLTSRLRLRRAATGSELAFQYARRGDAKKAALASADALRELALVEKLELGDGDQSHYEETAVRVAAARWPSEEAVVPAGKVALRVLPGSHPCESCLALLPQGSEQQPKPLAERCTFS